MPLKSSNSFSMFNIKKHPSHFRVTGYVGAFLLALSIGSFGLGFYHQQRGLIDISHRYAHGFWISGLLLLLWLIFRAKLCRCLTCGRWLFNAENENETERKTRKFPCFHCKVVWDTVDVFGGNSMASGVEYEILLDRITINQTFPPVARLIVFGFALFPLLAPYELIIKPNWPSFWNIGFLFCFFISSGAILITLSFVLRAFLGLNRTIIFDSVSKNLIYRWSSPVHKLRERQFLFKDIFDVSVKEVVESDGPDSFEIVIFISREPEISFSGFYHEAEAQNLKDLIKTMLRESL